MKRTYQTKKLKRKRKHDFRLRMRKFKLVRKFYEEDVVNNLLNYQKYLLKYLDEKKFLENELHLSFDSQHHLYKYDGKIVNNLEHRVNILAKIEQLKISQTLKKQFIAEFLKQEYAILETVTEKYGGAKKILKL